MVAAYVCVSFDAQDVQRQRQSILGWVEDAPQRETLV